MRVIGIDPGVATTGYGVVERAGNRLSALDFGVIRTSRDADHEVRLAEIAGALRALLARHRVDAAAVERVFFNSNVKTAMSVGQASGVALASIGELKVAVAEYTPLEVKQSVVGVGHASKRQVQTMVAQLLGLEGQPSPADAADACALAICHLNRSALSRAIARAEPPRAEPPRATQRAPAARSQGADRDGRS